MVPKSQRFLWIGSTRQEFQPILALLRQRGSVHLIPTLAEATSISRQDVAVLVQDRPGELQLDRINQVLAPRQGTRSVILLGGWCSGEKRLRQETSLPLVYAHEGPQAVCQAIAPECSVPLPALTNACSPLVAIYSPVASYREAIADTLASWGLKTVEAEVTGALAVHGVDAVIWDRSGSAGCQQLELERIRKRHPRAKIIALMTYPREFERQNLQQQRVEVLAAPFPLEHLAMAVGITGPSAVTAAA